MNVQVGEIEARHRQLQGRRQSANDTSNLRAPAAGENSHRPPTVMVAGGVRYRVVTAVVRPPRLAGFAEKEAVRDAADSKSILRYPRRPRPREHADQHTDAVTVPD
jgi:hypothetical protein